MIWHFIFIVKIMKKNIIPTGKITIYSQEGFCELYKKYNSKIPGFDKYYKKAKLQLRKSKIDKIFVI